MPSKHPKFRFSPPPPSAILHLVRVTFRRARKPTEKSDTQYSATDNFTL